MGDHAHLPRRLDGQHQGRCARPGTSSAAPTRIRADYPWELYDLAQGLDAVRRRRGEEPGEAEGAAGALLEGGGEIPGAAAGRDGGDSPDHAAPEHHRRPQRVHLDARR